MKIKWRQWIRWRWLELRWGSGNYLTQVVTFVNFVLLISLKFNVIGNTFVFLFVVSLVGLSSLAIVLGYLHRIWQQDTDARLTNKAVIEDIVKGVLEGIEKKKLGKIGERES